MTLDEIKAQVDQCSRCNLCLTKTNYVVGKGNPNADIMFIGEAPGKNEDIQGLPFVGAAGKNLDSMLNTINLTLDDVYIANILKCRPPNNRNPEISEITACTPFLNLQIEAVNPKIIVTLGNFATQYILGTELGISLIHGNLYIKQNSPAVFPMYHPAAALYNPSIQNMIKNDFKKLQNHLANMP